MVVAMLTVVAGCTGPADSGNATVGDDGAATETPTEDFEDAGTATETATATADPTMTETESDDAIGENGTATDGEIGDNETTATMDGNVTTDGNATVNDNVTQDDNATTATEPAGNETNTTGE